ncbi:MAG: MoxR family ATPase [Pirellulaceae bacterium]|nr:MoxR family ATPase [Pirellulaceae bacterium]
MAAPASSSDSFTIRCSHCQGLFDVPYVKVGTHVSCPHCQAVLVVPPAPQSSGPQSNAPQTSVSSTSQSNVGLQSARSESRSAMTAANESMGQRATSEPETPAQDASSSLMQLVREGHQSPGKDLYDRMTREISKVFVGQDELVLGTLVGLFSSGHVLIESVPGLGKTLFVRTLGQVLGCDFGRIQFTPDLMPSDVTGTPIFNVKTQEFYFHAGPVFTKLLLADEINRAPAKTHAALLETMQEYRVTIDSQVHPMPRPFFVLATQNPIESEGTYNLPEAQLDRFMFQLRMDYPSLMEETTILKMHGGQANVDDQLQQLNRITSSEEILQFTKATEAVRVEEAVIDYIAKVVRQTRHWPQIHLGASPRAGITLMRAARTLAMFAGRDFVVPDDISHLYRPALRHRIILTPEAEVEGFSTDQVLTDVLRTVEVPRMN